MKIAAFSGSLRRDSFNTKLLHAFQKLAPPGMEIEMLDISVLPLYNQDREAAYPAEAQALKDKVLAADGVLFVTPEYNRSIPGFLKNAIDWLSRPYGANAFKGKPTLISGTTGGKIGTALAQAHLKNVMLYLDAKVIGQPELYIGGAMELFDAEGNVKEESTKELLQKGLATLGEWAGK